ncbi:hypothetical protein ACU21_01565 [Actinobaculum suis]|nr:hypothetical protein ACU21_01565 [Actinobaculum suis]
MLVYVRSEVFPRRSTRGVILGLGWAQVVAIGIPCLVAIVVMIARGFDTALVVGLPLVGLGLVAAFVPVGGKKIAEWVWPGIRFGIARLSRQYRYEASLLRPRDNGLVRLPGMEGTLRLLEDPRESVAEIFDASNRTLTVVGELAYGQFLSLPEEERDGRADAWGMALTQIGQLSGVERLQILIRTSPDRGEDLARAYEVGRDESRSGSKADLLYQDLLEASAALMREYRTFIAVQISARKTGGLVRELGGGTLGLSRAISDTRRQVEEALAGVGVRVDQWLPASELSRLIRSTYDPRSGEQIAADPQFGADISYSGPVAVEDGADHLVTDGGYFQVWTVNQWPRIAATAGFLRPLVMETVGQVTLSLIYEPVETGAALAAANREVAAEESARRERLKRGRVDTVVNVRERAGAMNHLDDIAAGHGEFKMGCLVAVSGQSMNELRRSGARLKAAATKKNIDLRIAYLMQSEAFIAGALPLARPL